MSESASDEAVERDEAVDGEATRLVPIATRILFEDDQVRIWDQVLEPGERTGPHRHELPYALITVEGESLEVIPVAGHPSIYGSDPIPISLTTYSVHHVPPGATEDALNTGSRRFRAILIEHKSA